MKGATGRSLANPTREDGIAFLRLPQTIGIITTVIRYLRRQANKALADPRAGESRGAAVLVSGQPGTAAQSPNPVPSKSQAPRIPPHR